MQSSTNSVPDAHHPFQTCPPLPSAEFEYLKESIRAQGVIAPLVVDDEGNIIDGHHRLLAWQELHDSGCYLPEPERRVVEGLSHQQKLTLSRALNITHRSLTNSQKSALVDAELRERLEHADRKIAQDLGVSHTLVSKRRAVLVSTGEIQSVNTAVGLDGKVRPRKPVRDDHTTGSVCQLNSASGHQDETGDERSGQPAAPTVEGSEPVAVLLRDADASPVLPTDQTPFVAASRLDVLSVLDAHRQKVAPMRLFHALLEHFDATVESIDEQGGGHKLILILTPNNATTALAA